MLTPKLAAAIPRLDRATSVRGGAPDGLDAAGLMLKHAPAGSGQHQEHEPTAGDDFWNGGFELIEED
jgi:hypothetical protein